MVPCAEFSCAIGGRHAPELLALREKSTSNKNSNVSKSEQYSPTAGGILLSLNWIGDRWVSGPGFQVFVPVDCLITLNVARAMWAKFVTHNLICRSSLNEHTSLQSR